MNSAAGNNPDQHIFLAEVVHIPMDLMANDLVCKIAHKMVVFASASLPSTTAFIVALSVHH
jgi:hypothetical protein